MPHKHDLWIWYITAALLVLLGKLGKFILQGFVGKKYDKQLLKELVKIWFFEATKDNVASWAATIGVVWVLGWCYINQVTWFFADLFNAAPIAIPIAFLLGALAEIGAPNAVKWLVSKIPGNAGGV